MPNSLAFGWVEDLDSDADELTREPGVGPDRAVVGRVAPDAVAGAAEMPMSNIEVEWLPVEAYVLVGQ